MKKPLSKVAAKSGRGWGSPTLDNVRVKSPPSSNLYPRPLSALRTTTSQNGFVLHNHVCRKDAAPIRGWIDDRVAADDAAGIQNGIATDVRAVAQQSAEFPHAGVERHAVLLHHHIAGEHFHVRDFHPRAKMGLVAKDGIAHVAEMRHDAVIEKK